MASEALWGLYMKRILQIFILLLAATSVAAGLSYADEAVIKTSKEGGYTLYVKGKPFLMKGVIYSPGRSAPDMTRIFFSTRKNPGWLTAK